MLLRPAAAGSGAGASTRATSTILSDGFESGHDNVVTLRWAGRAEWGRTTQPRPGRKLLGLLRAEHDPRRPGPYPNSSDNSHVPTDLSTLRDATAATVVFD